MAMFLAMITLRGDYSFHAFLFVQVEQWRRSPEGDFRRGTLHPRIEVQVQVRRPTMFGVVDERCWHQR